MKQGRTLLLMAAILAIAVTGSCARPGTQVQIDSAAAQWQRLDASQTPGGSAAGLSTAAGTRWGNCPLGDLDQTAQGTRIDFPVSAVAPSGKTTEERDVLVVRFTSESGPIYQSDPSFGSRPTDRPVLNWLTFTGPDNPDARAWDLVFSKLGTPAPNIADQSTIYVVGESFREDEHVWLAAMSETAEPVSCSVTRLPIPSHTILSLNSLEIRPGGYGPIQVGISGAELLAYGVVEPGPTHWVNRDALAERGISFASKGADDHLYQIDVSPDQGTPVAGLGISFQEDAVPAGITAVRLHTDAGERAAGVADKWVLFSDEGALTLWVRADGSIRRASATAGTDLATYQPPQAGM